MKASYKFWYILKKDDIHIDQVAVRFCEGEVNTQKEKDVNNDTEIDVTRYRISRQLSKSELEIFGGKIIQDGYGNSCVVFTKDDFGEILDEDELRVFLNKKLKLLKTHEPVDEQKEEDIVKLKKQAIK